MVMEIKLSRAAVELIRASGGHGALDFIPPMD
jgi:hypothetical protein